MGGRGGRRGVVGLAGGVRTGVEDEAVLDLNGPTHEVAAPHL